MGGNITPYAIKMPNDLLPLPAYNAPNTVTDYEAKQLFRRFIDMDMFLRLSLI